MSSGMSSGMAWSGSGCGWVGEEAADVVAVVLELEDGDYGRSFGLDAAGGHVLRTHGAVTMTLGQHVLRRH